jgi:hypothetical protein
MSDWYLSSVAVDKVVVVLAKAAPVEAAAVESQAAKQLGARGGKEIPK